MPHARPGLSSTLLTLPLLLTLCAGTCLAQEKPADPPKEQEPEKVGKPAEKKPAEPGKDSPLTAPVPTKQEAPARPFAPPSPPPPPAAPLPKGLQTEPDPEPGAPDPSAPMPGNGAKSADAPVPADTFRLGPYSEEIAIKILADLVAQELRIQIISTDQALRDKKVSLLPNAIEVKRSQLLPFLQLLLEQNGMQLKQEVADVWIISAANDLASALPGREWSTTQVLSCEGLRPTSLQNAITAGRAAVSPGGGAQTAPAYLDDLGVIVITDTPRRIAAVQELIHQIAEQQRAMQITSFELKHIAAPVARARVLQLAGQLTLSIVPNNPGDPNAAAMNAAAAGGNTPGASPNTANLAQRLLVNPQGNALLFRGRPDELTLIEKLIPIVDAPNELEPRYYDMVGAILIAEQASAQGLGEVRVMRSLREGIQQGATGFNPNQPGQNMLNMRSAITDMGGPTFIVDPEGRGFIYYGTPQQHARLDLLVNQYKSAIRLEDVVYEFYKLKHAGAVDTAELIRGLISNQAVGGSSGLLPGGQRNTNTTANRRTTTPNQPQVNPNRPQPTGTGELTEIVASEDIFVQADERNNQLVVKAPRRLQPQFAKLIEKLDLRRAQVYIDAKIVVVTDTDAFRLAIESQLINAGGTGGALRTLFGPSAMPLPTTGGNITSIPVITPLSGATAAIIKTGSVAATINAIANTTDAKIVASPQLLVDDNEEAEVASLEQRPTLTTTQSSTAGSTQTSFGGFEDAGPKLKVKPRISTSNSLEIKYEVELSSFVGDPPDPSSPPPKQKNNIRSDSVTIPSDSTIVVGGLTFEQKDHTVIKVPLLGDIPLIGQLFRDERRNNNKRTVYVFITPRVMRDSAFDDLRLNSEGPMSSVRITDPLSPPRPVAIPIGPVDGGYDRDRNGWRHPTPRPGAPSKPVKEDPPAAVPETPIQPGSGNP